jgi:nucleoside-diphosphate-sugar epimerase
MAAGGGEGWIDVRDVALMHKLALEKPEAAGQRVIANAGAFKWQDFRTFVSTLHTNAL